MRRGLLAGVTLAGVLGAVGVALAADPETTWREELRARFPSAGVVNLAGLRTADGYAVGDVWNDNGTLKVCVATTTSSTSTTSTTTSSSTTTTSSTSTTTSTTSSSSTTA